jgi:hypothetical protein
MLTSLGPKTTDEIQRSLTGFANGYDQTQQDLEMFLVLAQGEGLVEQRRDGKWVLPVEL